MQAPLLHWSPEVQELPSLHCVVSGLFVTVQPPLPSHADADWHMLGVQLYMLPTQAPFLHMSPDVQVWPSLQPTPSALGPPSTQIWAPLEQSVIPFLQKVGLVVHAAPAVQEMHRPALSQTWLGPHAVPGAFGVLLLQTAAPLLQSVTPVKQGFGLVVQAAFCVQAPQLPLPSQTWLVPQLVPPALLPPSAQVCAPVEQDVVPFLHAFGLPVQVLPAVQATQLPEPLQTMLAPQPTPAALLLPSVHIWLPLEQDVVPFLQMLGLPVHDVPAVQATQVPEPLQTMFIQQLAPAALLPPSTQVMAPVEHDVTPSWQTPGLPVQEVLAVQATQPPEPLQTMFVPQPMPGDLLVPSVQDIAPVEQDVVPFLQVFGLPVHELPTVQAMQLPEPSQTMLAPQLVPPAFGVPFTHIAEPVEQEAMPLKQGFGLPEQLAPFVHMPQKPLPSQTWFDPHDVPPATFPDPSTQVGAPVVHEMMPVLHCDGLPLHDVPAVHITQAPEPSQTWFVPQAVPAPLAAPSVQVATPVEHDVTPLRQAAWGFVVQPWPAVQSAHCPLALQT